MSSAARVLSPYLASLAFVVTACGSGSSVSVGGGSDFLVLRTSPADNGTAFLNDPISIDFSRAVDAGTADFNAVSFAVFDLSGRPLSEAVEGRFEVTKSIGDDAPGRRLEFHPRLPRTDTFDDGGLRPGRRYLVQLVKGDHRRNVGLLDGGGRGLREAVSFTFETVTGSTPQQLFRDAKVGGPRKVGFAVTPQDPVTGRVELNELGQIATEVLLEFDQGINPHSSNIPLRLDLDPRRRDIRGRGRIYLEYADPVRGATWIPAALELLRNGLSGALVVLRPLGVLPNNAEVRVIVEAGLQDLSGESNEGDSSYDEVFASFRTAADYGVRFDALVESFTDAGRFDFEAPLLEPLADVIPGGIRAAFDFEGAETNLDYRPSSQEVVLDTDFTQINPSNGQPINVSGGVFVFRNVEVPLGVTVRGVGSNPMVWLVTGDFRVAGELTVEGGDGLRTNAINSANTPSSGGVGRCGGGNGGRGSPGTSIRSQRGETGFGPGQVPGGGGQGGRIACASSCRRGSGGGGGSFATQGDPYFKLSATTQGPQPSGRGGFGCPTVLPGGEPGAVEFRDARDDNDFWGAAVDLNRRVRITGELTRPRGGQGGGGGGDQAVACATNDPAFFRDQRGGGAGAGGGVLIVKALGRIILERTGRISADGGDGGGGAFAGQNTQAGGGGGGAGGMVVLMAARSLEWEVHGETYAQNDYDFAITADGGVGLSDGDQVINGKYRPAPHTWRGDTHVRGPSSGAGGLGGSGIVQLMVRPGPDPAGDDGTNTVLDDFIVIRRGNTVLTGAEKERFLAWRGMPDGKGVFRDDDGDPVDIGARLGDIQPAPLLMPAPFGFVTRLQSRWIDLGAVDRRVTAAGGDGLPRGVAVGAGAGTFGPRPEFAGVVPATGHVATVPDGSGGVRIDHPVVATGLAVAELRNSVAFRGQLSLRATLRAPDPRLGATPNRYAHHVARLWSGPNLAGERRILGHDGETLHLSAGGGPLDLTGPRSYSIDVLAKFFAVFTGAVEGLAPTYTGSNGQPVPVANVRIGFAFHRDPSDPSAPRFPAAPGSFFTAWDDAEALRALGAGGYRFVKYDVLFDGAYEPDRLSVNPTVLGPSSPRPELRGLTLPYRF